MFVRCRQKDSHNPIRRHSTALSTGIASAGLVAALSSQVASSFINTSAASTKCIPHKKDTSLENSSVILSNRVEKLFLFSGFSPHANDRRGAGQNKHKKLPIYLPISLRKTAPIIEVSSCPRLMQSARDLQNISVESLEMRDVKKYPRRQMIEGITNKRDEISQQTLNDSTLSFDNSLLNEEAPFSGSTSLTMRTSKRSGSALIQMHQMRMKPSVKDEFEEYCRISHCGGGMVNSARRSHVKNISSHISVGMTSGEDELQRPKEVHSSRGGDIRKRGFISSRPPRNLSAPQSPSPSPRHAYSLSSRIPQCSSAISQTTLPQSGVNEAVLNHPTGFLSFSHLCHGRSLLSSSNSKSCECFLSRDFQEDTCRWNEQPLSHDHVTNDNIHTNFGRSQLPPSRMMTSISSRQFPTFSMKPQDNVHVRRLRKNSNGDIVNCPMDSGEMWSIPNSSGKEKLMMRYLKRQRKVKIPRLSRSAQNSSSMEASRTTSVASNSVVILNPAWDNSRKPLFKVYILGGKEVGKASLCEQLASSECLLGREVDSNCVETEKYINVQYDGEEYHLELVNSGWLSEGGHSMETISFDDADGLIFLYAIDDKNSFKHVIHLLKVILHYGRIRTPAVLVANKIDLVRTREVSTESGKRLAQAYGCSYTEISTTLNHKVNELLVLLVTALPLKNWSNSSSEAVMGSFNSSTLDSPGDISRGLRDKGDRLMRFLRKRFLVKSCEELLESSSASVIFSAPGSSYLTPHTSQMAPASPQHQMLMKTKHFNRIGRQDNPSSLDL